MTIDEDHSLAMSLSRPLLSLGVLALTLSVRAQTMCDARIAMNSTDSSTTSGATGASNSMASDVWGADRVGRVAVSYGVVKAYARTVMTDTNSTNGHFTWSYGTWQDDVTINAAGREGQTGQVRVAFTVDGTLAATNSGGSGVQSTAGAQVDIRVNSDQGAIYYENYRPLTGTTTNVAGGLLNHQMTPTFNFTFGQPFHLYFQLYANASERHERGVLDSSATVDLEHTALWNGFDAVMDASGNSVAGYSVSSGSGTNWAQAVQPVPEPATLAILGAGGLALLRRRKR